MSDDKLKQWNKEKKDEDELLRDIRKKIPDDLPKRDLRAELDAATNKLEAYQQKHKEITVKNIKLEEQVLYYKGVLKKLFDL